jgi:hypothetical protein
MEKEKCRRCGKLRTSMEHREKCNEEVAKLMLQRLGIEV